MHGGNRDLFGWLLNDAFSKMPFFGEFSNWSRFSRCYTLVHSHHVVVIEVVVPILADDISMRVMGNLVSIHVLTMKKIYL